jgi:hypothetical protein
MMRGRDGRAFEPAEATAHAGGGAERPLDVAGRWEGPAPVASPGRGGEGIQIAPRHFYFIADPRLS